MIETLVYFDNKKHPWTKQAIGKIVAEAERFEPKIFGAVEIHLVGDTRIKKLNKQYRGIDKPTDVLSFAWKEDPHYKGALLGQIYMSVPYIVRQAKRFKVSVKEEFTRMLVHGLLHIVGYDHMETTDAKKMFALQEKIVVKAYRP